MTMKTIGASFLALGAGVLIVLCATNGGGMYAQTSRAERNRVGELKVGQELTLGGDLSQTIAQAPVAKSSGAKVQKVVALTEKDDAQTVVVKTGEKIEIKLDSNPSTGYGWRVASVSAKSVKQDGTVTYVSTPLPPGSPPMVGRGGSSLIRFDALSPGKVTVKLEYLRPWEKNTPPARTFTVTLDVK